MFVCLFAFLLLLAIVSENSATCTAFGSLNKATETNQQPPPVAKVKEMPKIETATVAPTAVVIGAGPAGLSVSLGLSCRGWNVILIEKYGTFDIRGANFGLAPNGIKALEEIHPGVVQSGMLEAGRAVKTPSGGLVLPWWMMRDALLERVRARVGMDDSDCCIDLRMGLSIEDIVDEAGSGRRAVQVKLSNGEIVAGDLVIGADGVHSSVRDIMGLPKNELTGSKVFRGSAQVQLETQKSSPEDRLLEELLHKGLVPLSVTYPDIHFFVINFHPDIKGKICWVFSTRDSNFNPGETSIQSLFKKYENDERKLTTILGILNASSDDSLSSFTETKVADFSDDFLSRCSGRWGGKGRVTLIGDAAHAMRPTDGQGGNMAFEDSIVLCRLLEPEHLRSAITCSSQVEPGADSDATSGKIVEEALGEFERTRLPRVKKMHDNQRIRYNARMKGEKVGPWTSKFKEWAESGV